MHKGSWEPPEWVDVTTVNWWVFISAWATNSWKFIAVHPLLSSIRFFILHPKENTKQACFLHAFLILPNPWKESWNLRIYFGINKDVMREADWRSTRRPRADRQGHVAGWETHILVLWSCIFQRGSGRRLRLNWRLGDQSECSWTWRWFSLLYLLPENIFKICPRFWKLSKSPLLCNFALK